MSYQPLRNFARIKSSLKRMLSRVRILAPKISPKPSLDDLSNLNFGGLLSFIISLSLEVVKFIFVLTVYSQKKTLNGLLRIEKSKNWFKKWLMWRRGVLFRPATHGGVVILSVLVVGIASAFGGNQIEATSISPTEGGLLIAGTTSETIIPEDRVRSEIVTHVVMGGETLGAIAKKYEVNVESIQWLNKLQNVNEIAPGDELRIPPLSGVVHKVQSGDNIDSIAKKYQANTQAIVDYPFNYLDDSFALRVGQELVVPEGVPPAAPKPKPVTPTYLANGGSASPKANAGASGKFLWPTSGDISQYPVWYHMAVDIANSAAPGVAVADSGTVTLVQYLRWGYGYHVIVDHGNGYQTLYAHMNRIYVNPGDKIAKGRTLGQMGSTGRSTGTHLHFEIRKAGVTLNPLSYF
ncbi:MAG: hypothetical protein A2802_00510 [Candidatus Woykebacteria bacterium RIFCSPHIGHO2_01_FULL_43_29]|uniref:LysM domain-containing protein n=2 Tax=Candidatus Woykeibacteriota TaxID=1817899 RepID=A0A1G1WUY2_9BACT|nr:MAG: hypothetical protein A2802_00510 [Candidatus Woykebacteria bacterium RIFCSPHIGHO2_01_FULL_43_29]OGY28828.1 MAG: hypothetical protein A3J50_02400 [Candidatus Woykebacteria bacterium RIFCSPHIGHO2_02_FULL_43_16b]OGY31552.1 MAG: hypothetical protein A3A61_03540 [Candidatus Woykebacteria bacterium RIFCSPLOWO2_01_FULL_43_14]